MPTYCSLMYIPAADVFIKQLNLPFKLNLFLSPSYLLLQIGIFFVGMYFLSRKFKNTKDISIYNSLFAVLIVIATVGFDFVSWRSCFFPFLLLALISENLVLLFIASLFWSISASSLSFFGSSAAVLIVFLLFNVKRYLYLPLLMSVFMGFPQAILPDYPSEANLLPIRLDQLSTIFAPSVLTKYIDYSQHYLFVKNSSLLFSISFLLYFCFTKPLCRPAIMLYLFAVLTFIGELFSVQFLPYKFFYRVIPGIAVFPFIWDLTIIFTVSIFSTVLNFTFIKSSHVKNMVLLLILALLSTRAIKLDVAVLNPNLDFSSKVKLSPSAYLLNYWGERVLNLESRKFLKLEQGRDFFYHISASQNAERVEAVFDRDLLTRWNTNGQRGDEQLKIELTSNIELAKIVLNQGKYRSDFPRGLKIEILDKFGNSNIAFEKNNWLGPVRFSPTGFPYFGAQAEVEVVLAETFSARQIIISQTGKDKTFDWSIAELELYASRD